MTTTSPKFYSECPPISRAISLATTKDIPLEHFLKCMEQHIEKVFANNKPTITTSHKIVDGWDEQTLSGVWYEYPDHVNSKKMSYQDIVDTCELNGIQCGIHVADFFNSARESGLKLFTCDFREVPKTAIKEFESYLRCFSEDLVNVKSVVEDKKRKVIIKMKNDTDSGSIISPYDIAGLWFNMNRVLMGTKPIPFIWTSWEMDLIAPDLDVYKNAIDEVEKWRISFSKSVARDVKKSRTMKQAALLVAFLRKNLPKHVVRSAYSKEKALQRITMFWREYGRDFLTRRRVLNEEKRKAEIKAKELAERKLAAQRPASENPWRRKESVARQVSTPKASWRSPTSKPSGDKWTVVGKSRETSWRQGQVRSTIPARQNSQVSGNRWQKGPPKFSNSSDGNWRK